MAEIDPMDMVDWQSNKTFAETNKYMWTHKIDCDVTFLVGKEEEKVEAHKYILISRSSVFYTMFKGSLPVDPDKPLHVPDIQPDIFKQLLLYLYTESIQVTPDNVLALLHASKIYLVQGLINKCLQKLKGKMMKSNLCLSMEAAHVFGENELREMCRTEILRDPKRVLPTESLAELCSDCLALVISNDNLQMQEEEIFECIIKYSEEKCRRDSLPITPDNQRLVLGKALHEIRYKQMKKEYFSEKVEPLGILTAKESIGLIKYMLNLIAAVQPFNMSLRCLHRIVKRFETHSAGWTFNYRNQADAIEFECDKDIELHGVLTYGSCEGPKQFDACIKVLEANKPHVIQVFKIKSDGHTKYYDCLFSKQKFVKRNTKFTVMLEMKPGRTTFYGENGKEFVENAGVKFKFMNSSLSLNNTRISRGQIPGLIFKVANIDGYLYTETVEITPDNVLAVLHASKIYLVQGLVNKCLQKLKGKMMTSNLCLIMEAAHVFGENELREMCRTEILRDPKQVLPMESLAELCSDCLALVIKDNNLQMEEEEIFECIVKYSKEKCRKDSLPLTPENKRLVLGKALQEIRFTEMEKEYFVDKVEPLAILTQGESKAVIKYMLNPRKAEQPPFNMALRRLHRIVKRFETHSAGWTYNYRHEPDAIMFECDQDIELHGVLTYGSCDGPKQFDACIKVLEASKPHVIQVYKITSDGHTKYYDCLFSSPVLVQRNTKYTVLLEMKPGRTTFYGENGQELVENAGVKFKFMNSSLSLNNTRISRGQIPGLIFKVENIDV